MDAYERIDEYEVLDGVALTEAQEESVAGGIRAALDEFKPLRLNTRQTRTLFNKKYHLWPVQVGMGYMIPREEPLKADKVELNSLVFLYALYTVVKEDQSYCHLRNMIVKEILSRNSNLRWIVEYGDEEHVDFFVYFNIADIRREAERMNSAADRLTFLESKLEKLNQYDFSSYVAKVKVKLFNNTESQLLTLIHEARADLETSLVATLQENGVIESSASDVVDEEHAEDILVPDWSDDSLLFYNPSILGLAHFQDIDFELYANYASSDADNQEFFKTWLYFTFTSCYYYDSKSKTMVTEYSKIWAACSKIRRLFDDYVSRLENSEKEWPFLSKADSMSYWIRVTLAHIEEAYNRFDFIDSSQSTGKGEAPLIIGTAFLRNGLVSYAFSALISHRKVIHGDVCDRFNSVVFYNFWPDTYEEDFEKYYGQVGLTPENRAKVFLKANRDYYRGKIKETADEFISDFEKNSDAYSYLSERVMKSTAKMLQDFFYDYMLRLKSLYPTEEECVDTGLNWIIETMHIVKTQLVEQIGKSRIRPYMSEDTRDAYEYFYLDCCLSVLNKMLADFIEDSSELHNSAYNYSSDLYFDDSGVGECEWELYDGDQFEINEDGEIVPTCSHGEEQPKDSENLAKEDLAADDENKPESSKRKEYSPRGGVSINVEAIYNLINDMEKTSLAIDDFRNAIKYADFVALREDGSKHGLKDYPLLIISKLKDLFESDWYTACCKSLNMEPTRVTGYHREGTMGKLIFRFPGNLTLQ